MFDPVTVITIFCLYMGLLFLVATWVERKAAAGINLADNPVVYSLSLAVYCTTWTFYGSVGMAATSEMLFLTIYLGPTIAFILAWGVLRKLVRIKSARRITSIADFISARYDKSQALAALATLICLIGIAPYIALQLRAVISTFNIIVATTGPTATSWVSDYMEPVLLVLMILFTNLFGVRRIDPTERHPGVVTAVALESLIKLAAFLAAGIFVTYFIYDGFGDLFQRVSDDKFRTFMNMEEKDGTAYITWTTYLILAMSAIMFLPRQFHVSVVENFREDHIRTAMWLFPLYMVLINLFTWPIAIGGLLMGFPAGQADTFPLLLPFYYKQRWLSLLVFIGGFSAATSMIMISAMTLATMTTNHLLFPMLGRFRLFGLLRQHLFRCRWAAVAGIILIGYGFERTLGESYMLVSMGLISFAAVLQFAPPILGGIFWRQGNRAGALAGLSAGFLIWLYTLLLPAFVKSGWISPSLTANGPWGIAFLRPEQLFGLSGLPPLSHTFFWSLLFNVGLYVTGSLFFRQSRSEQALAAEFVEVLSETPARLRFAPRKAHIDLIAKKRIVKKVLRRYFADENAAALLENAVAKAGCAGKDRISIAELAELYAEAEKILAGAVGAATAHVVMREKRLFTPEEAEELSTMYGEILAGLKVTPEDLKRKIHYYQEKEALLNRHAAELEATVREREKEIVQRRRAEAELKRSERKYRDLFESAPDGIIITGLDGKILSFNDAFMRIFKVGPPDAVYGSNISAMYQNPEKDRPEMLAKLQAERRLEDYQLEVRDRSGRKFPASFSLRLIRYEDMTCIQSMVRDISRIKKMEADLKCYAENLEKMVDEKTGELTCANTELSATVKSLEETREQLALRAHQAGMAEVAVSILHNIGNAINSVNVRSGELEKTLISGEIESLKKIYERLRSEEMRPEPGEAGDAERVQLFALFSLTLDILKKKSDVFRDDIRFMRKGIHHIMEIITIQQKYAGLRGFETRVDINDLLRDAEEMLLDSITKRGIETAFYPEELPELLLDKNKMIQNFINILKNAYESIDMAPPENEKRIEIRTSREKRETGDYVQVVIADTGTGVSPDIRDKVFRFNFSTKGRQTGFGLHDSANYIRAQGGFIELLSDGPGKGARVVIRLPISKEPAKGTV